VAAGRTLVPLYPLEGTGLEINALSGQGADQSRLLRQAHCDHCIDY